MKKLTKMVSCKFSSDDFARIEQLAKQNNISVSEYIRQSVSNSKVKPNNAKIIGQVLTSQNRIGNNINQLAKKVNISYISGKITRSDCKEIMNSLNYISYILTQIYKAIK